MFKIGQTIIIEGHKLFESMGYELVSGEVISVKKDGEDYIVKFECDQTGQIETFDGGGCLVTVLN